MQSTLTTVCSWTFTHDYPKMRLAHGQLRNLILLRTSLLVSLPELAVARLACFASQPLAYGIVHEQAISINTDVLFNTTLFSLPEVAVMVSNAPTSLDGVSTFYWTQTKTYMSDTGISPTSSAPEVAATSTDTSFVLLAMGLEQRQKRQSGSYYVSANGTITNDCTTIPLYTISNGALTATINGIVYIYSTSPGTLYTPFVPSTVLGSITTTFSLGNSQALNWWNPAFYNGQASFCALSNGTVYAVF